MNLTVLQLIGSLSAIALTLLIGQKRRWPLDFSLILAGFLLSCIYFIPPWEWALISLKSLTDPGMLALMAALAPIVAMSSLMEETGQNRLLMASAKAHIHAPKFRLAFFPAIIGLIPVVGGALFSCPMVKELSADMHISEERKGLINLWFRHIWEPVWPMYPGFILICVLGEISAGQLIGHTFPLWFCSVGIGWFFLLRNIKAPDESAIDKPQNDLKETLRLSLPILVGLFLSFFLQAVLPIKAGFSFCIGFSVGVLICARQNGCDLRRAASHFVSKKVFNMLRIILGIFLFKGVLTASPLVAGVTELIQNSPSKLVAVCILLPIISGIVTGILVGAVGCCLPIIIPLLHQAGLWDERLSFLALICLLCYAGEMISPTHVCIAVTSEFFDTPIGSMLKHLLPLSIAFSFICILVFALYRTVGW